QWVMRWEGISPQLGASGETVLAFVHADHLGTPQKMTDEGGAVVWSADYMPFGEAEVTVGGMENNIRFPGQYFDQETGLHYNYFRDYHPTIGRYLTPEPLSLSQMEIGRQSAIDVSVQSYGSPLTLPHLSNLLAINLLYQATLYNPQALNLYPYVHNNPILFVDPHGQFLQSLVAGGIAGGIVGGITFITDLAKGASFEDAAKSAVISGATSGVSVGLASTGLGFLVAGSAATATNAALQKIMNGDIELGRALFSGFATSAGGFALSGAGLQGATLGVVGGQIAAPVGLVGDVLFSSNAQDRQAPCK
ncbi:MAG: RHS domain-containing protein, partial [Deltaproteobacteria bacterium]|nr:RHS domain-containing protein [Deltaproteobacteria bacterium]